MLHRIVAPRNLMALGTFFVAVIGGAAVGGAQGVGGQAKAVQASVLGLGTVALADTGTLGSSTDARQASQSAGSIASLLQASALHATAIGYADEVASEASLANLAISINGTTIGADFVMAKVTATNVGGIGLADVEGLTVNGLPVAVTGAPNQRVAIPGGVIVINEQGMSGPASVVNALHIAINGVADMVIASATGVAQ